MWAYKLVYPCELVIVGSIVHVFREGRRIDSIEFKEWKSDYIWCLKHSNCPIYTSGSNRFNPIWLLDFDCTKCTYYYRNYNKLCGN